jgi:hypothetical protein
MNRIAEYIQGMAFADFKRDYKTVDAVIRNFEIIGEASRKVPERVKENIRRCLGLKCIYCEIRCRMNILALIMKLFGILL